MSDTENRAGGVRSRTWGWLSGVAERIIDPERREVDETELRRLRALTIMLLLVTAISMLSSWQLLFIEEKAHLATNNALIISGELLVLFLIHRGVSSSHAAQVLGGMFMGVIMLGALRTDGILGPASGALSVIPVLLTLSLGGKEGLLWGVVALACIVLLSVTTDGEPARIMMFASSAVIYTISLTGSAYAFDVFRGRALARAEEARQRAEAARAEAEAAAEAKARFLANMSHEIRTPMNGVLGMLGLLLDGTLAAKERDYAEIAHSSGVALLDLLNDILDFSKIEAGQMQLEAVPFNLRTLVEDVLDQLAVMADGKDLELISRYLPDTPADVMGDHGRIRQVLLNLVSNAVKFTNEGHVLVSVAHEPQEGAAWFRVEVEDTGIGIPPDRQESIFEDFQQVDMSTTRTHGGTGLGLAIVRDLVELMGGQLGVRSEPGRGSTFWLTLPLPLAAGAAPRKEASGSLAGARLLVVDDHEVNRRILTEQLGRWGLETVACASGPEALKLLHEAVDEGRPYQLALLDYHMPVMDGLELTRAIKQYAALQQTVLVMLSSVSHRVGTPEANEAGCAAYLVKPVHQSDLMDVLATAWEQRMDSGTAPVTLPTSYSRLHAQARPTGTSRARVLVVEDNAVNQKVARRMLEQLGCRVDIASNGREALEQVELAPYDVVFMDVQMPVMDGLAATRALRQREGDEERLPVVAMTAHAMASDRQICLDAGMDDYISKPVRRRELLRVLRMLDSWESDVEALER